jgi:hypothetical protein
LFKSVVDRSRSKAGPFQEYYDALVAEGIRLEMARLTLARKIAAITSIIWKKRARFALAPLCCIAQHRGELGATVIEWLIKESVRPQIFCRNKRDG